MPGTDRRQFDRFALHRSLAHLVSVHLPQGNSLTTMSLAQTFIGSKTDLSSGSPFTIYSGAPKYLTYPMSVSIMVEDADGAGLSITSLVVTGFDGFGFAQTEDRAASGALVDASGAGTFTAYQTTKAFSAVTSVVAAYTGGAAGDIIHIGQFNGTTTGTRARLWIPVKPIHCKSTTVQAVCAVSSATANSWATGAALGYSDTTKTVIWDLDATAGNLGIGVLLVLNKEDVR